MIRPKTTLEDWEAHFKVGTPEELFPAEANLEEEQCITLHTGQPLGIHFWDGVEHSLTDGLDGVTIEPANRERARRQAGVQQKIVNQVATELAALIQLIENTTRSLPIIKDKLYVHVQFGQLCEDLPVTFTIKDRTFSRCNSARDRLPVEIRPLLEVSYSFTTEVG